MKTTAPRPRRALNTAWFSGSAGALLLLCGACTTMEIQAPKKALVIQTAGGSDCKEIAAHAQVYALFGSVALLRPRPADIFAGPDGTSYRVRQVSRWYDVVISILAGSLLSITKNTLVVEQCGAADSELLQKDAARTLVEARQRELEQKLDSFVASRAQDPLTAGQIALVLRDGRTIAGRLTQITPAALFVETDGSPTEYARADIAAIRFDAAPAQNTPTPPGP